MATDKDGKKREMKGKIFKVISAALLVAALLIIAVYATIRGLI